ncbi:MAG: hypothetical protein ABII18_02160 [bacterium]
MNNTILMTGTPFHPMHQLSLLTGEALKRPLLGSLPKHCLGTVPQRITDLTLTRIKQKQNAMGPQKTMGIIDRTLTTASFFTKGLFNLFIKPKILHGMGVLNDPSEMERLSSYAHTLAYTGAQALALGLPQFGVFGFQASTILFGNIKNIAAENKDELTQILAFMGQGVNALYTSGSLARTHLDGVRILLSKLVATYEVGRYQSLITPRSEDFDSKEVEKMFQAKVAWGICLEHIADINLNTAFSSAQSEAGALQTSYQYYQLATNVFEEILQAGAYVSMPEYQRQAQGARLKFKELSDKKSSLQAALTKREARS